MNTIKVVNIIPQSPKLSSPNPSSPVSIEMDGNFIDFSGSRCSSFMCWSISGHLYLYECDEYTVCSIDLNLNATHNLLHMEKILISRVIGGNDSQECLTHYLINLHLLQVVFITETQRRTTQTSQAANHLQRKVGTQNLLLSPRPDIHSTPR